MYFPAVQRAPTTEEMELVVRTGGAPLALVPAVRTLLDRIVIFGVAVGAALSLAATRLIRNFLYGLEPRDPATLTFAPLILVAVGLFSAALPAVRAARLDPVAALREE